MTWPVTPAPSVGRSAMDVQHLPGFQLSESDLHLAEKRPVKLQTVLGNMNDDDAKSQFLEVVFEFKTPVH